MKWILLALMAIAAVADAQYAPALPPPPPPPVYNAPPPPVYNPPPPPPPPVYNAPPPPSPPTYNAPAPIPVPSYGIPVVPGPYGAVSQPHVTVTYVPGQLIKDGYHNSFYAPLFKSVYVPLPTTYAPPPPTPAGYGLPPPSPSYGVPATPPGPYGAPAPAPYAPPTPQYAIHQKKIGDAVVNAWLSQTVLQGGGKITETKIKDGYNGYKTIVNEEWQDQKPYYNFGFDIKSKLGYGATPYDELSSSAQESRHGYQTSGRYTVKQPDGRTRIVEYTADANGFKPVVTFV